MREYRYEYDQANITEYIFDYSQAIEPFNLFYDFSYDSQTIYDMTFFSNLIMINTLRYVGKEALNEMSMMSLMERRLINRNDILFYSIEKYLMNSLNIFMDRREYDKNIFDSSFLFRIIPDVNEKNGFGIEDHINIPVYTVDQLFLHIEDPSLFFTDGKTLKEEIRNIYAENPHFVSSPEKNIGREEILPTIVSDKVTEILEVVPVRYKYDNILNILETANIDEIFRDYVVEDIVSVFKFTLREFTNPEIVFLGKNYILPNILEQPLGSFNDVRNSKIFEYIILRPETKESGINDTISQRKEDPKLNVFDIVDINVYDKYIRIFDLIGQSKEDINIDFIPDTLGSFPSIKDIDTVETINAAPEGKQIYINDFFNEEAYRQENIINFFEDVTIVKDKSMISNIDTSENVLKIGSQINIFDIFDLYNDGRKMNILENVSIENVIENRLTTIFEVSAAEIPINSAIILEYTEDVYVKNKVRKSIGVGDVITVPANDRNQMIFDIITAEANDSYNKNRFFRAEIYSDVYLGKAGNDIFESSNVHFLPEGKSYIINENVSLDMFIQGSMWIENISVDKGGKTMSINADILNTDKGKKDFFEISSSFAFRSPYNATNDDSLYLFRYGKQMDFPSEDIFFNVDIRNFGFNTYEIGSENTRNSFIDERFMFSGKEEREVYFNDFYAFLNRSNKESYIEDKDIFIGSKPKSPFFDEDYMFIYVMEKHITGNEEEMFLSSIYRETYISDFIVDMETHRFSLTFDLPLFLSDVPRIAFVDFNLFEMSSKERSLSKYDIVKLNREDYNLNVFDEIYEFNRQDKEFSSHGDDVNMNRGSDYNATLFRLSSPIFPKFRGETFIAEDMLEFNSVMKTSEIHSIITSFEKSMLSLGIENMIIEVSKDLRGVGIPKAMATFDLASRVIGVVDFVKGIITDARDFTFSDYINFTLSNKSFVFNAIGLDVKADMKPVHFDSEGMFSKRDALNSDLFNEDVLFAKSMINTWVNDEKIALAFKAKDSLMAGIDMPRIEVVSEVYTSESLFADKRHDTTMSNSLLYIPSKLKATNVYEQLPSYSNGKKSIIDFVNEFFISRLKEITILQDWIRMELLKNIPVEQKQEFVSYFEREIQKLPYIQDIYRDSSLRDVFTIEATGVEIDDEFINSKAKGVDELLLPQNDFNYSANKEIYFDFETGKPKNTVEVIDDHTFLAAMPVDYPIDIDPSIGNEYIDIDVTLMKYLMEIFYTKWQTMIFELGAMDIKDGINKMLKYMEVFIEYRIPDIQKPQARRVLKLFRWYSEAIVLNHSRYKITIDYVAWTSDLYQGFINCDHEIENLFINDGFVLQSIEPGPGSLILRLEPKLDGEVSFSTRMANSILKVYINDMLTDTINISGKYSYPIERGPFELKLLFDGDIIKIGNIVVDKSKINDIYTRYEYEPGRANFAVDKLFQKLCAFYDITDNNLDAIEESIQGAISLMELSDRLITYYNDHHKLQSKGKRKIIKKGMI